MPGLCKYQFKKLAIMIIISSTILTSPTRHQAQKLKAKPIGKLGKNTYLAQDNPKVVYETYPANGDPFFDDFGSQPQVVYENQPQGNNNPQTRVQYVNVPSQPEPKVKYVNQEVKSPSTNNGQDSPQIIYVDKPVNVIEYQDAGPIVYKDPKWGEITLNLNEPCYKNTNWNDQRYLNVRSRDSLFKDNNGNWRDKRFSNSEFRNLFFKKMKQRYNKVLERKIKKEKQRKIKDPLKPNKPKIKCKVNLDGSKLKNKDRNRLVRLAQVPNHHWLSKDYNRFLRQNFPQRNFPLKSLAQSCNLSNAVNNDLKFLKKIQRRRLLDLPLLQH